ncbi:MAG TPA: hypothetical protein VGP31_18405, partial [Planosporangium sp.]|nr:hypothetical protein [Planosporangium sp.]
ADRRRVYAILTTGRQVRLPAVGAAELATFPDTATEKAAAEEATDEKAATPDEKAADEKAASEETGSTQRDRPAQ